MARPTPSKQVTRDDLRKIHEALYEISTSFSSLMRVPARVFVNEPMLAELFTDRSLWQLTNVATLPGIQMAALAMPDIHEGYGFPIGGVAAMDIAAGGVISPGGIGYDINCGVRLMHLPLTVKEVEPYLDRLASDFYKAVPSGVGRSGFIKLSAPEMNKVLRYGAKRMVELGYGNEEDLLYCESYGCLEDADPAYISDRARKRGSDQLGTLGSGNHFLEVQKIETIFDQQVAKAFGLEKDTVVIMIHCGSRGLGHQTCTDYVGNMLNKLDEWGIVLPDPELSCAPFNSPEGQDYYKAMCAAANFAWANRHVIGSAVRKACHKHLGSHINVRTVYDISHNIGKKEWHDINGVTKELIVHRKGATRAFPAGNPEVSEPYRAVGHPVFVPGTMGTASYVMVGTPEGMKESFGSCCHGAGRRMSRSKAKKTVHGLTLREQLKKQGIIVKSASDPGLAEEAPIAYKDVDNVVRVIEEANIAKRVVRLTPLAVIKGD